MTLRSGPSHHKKNMKKIAVPQKNCMRLLTFSNYR